MTVNRKASTNFLEIFCESRAGARPARRTGVAPVSILEESPPFNPSSETGMGAAGTAKVAEASQLAVSRVSKAASARTILATTNHRSPADWKVGDTAGWETCATKSGGPIAEFGLNGPDRILKTQRQQRRVRSWRQARRLSYGVVAPMAVRAVEPRCGGSVRLARVE